ncbi:queuosine precursor transporter [Rhodothermus marinus]|uniref:queuosine precursor transporter n=1 Tax=Rhodothermus marinus TaxID=29549 RepID=UPI0012BA55C7|nr:queuosine precursor transporter [Rhodothermus marinus]BBM71009.1 membrane protein [Rhodothermus marinus]BBM73988.1 membrane protein [Rhodothermus marinus]
MLREAYVLSRPQKVFVVCTAIFITALVLAEATASKFFTAFRLPFTLHLLGMTFGEVVMTAGVLAFPITFIVTDIMNEYFGKKGIRFVTMVGMGMVVFEFALLRLAIAVPAADISPVPQEAFETVFGATGRVILGSLTAYLLGQLADITLFHWLRRLTRGRWLWLRATGSTFGSQFIDTLVVLTVAFAGQLAFPQILAITLFNYGYKFAIAVAITPLIYLAHWLIDAYLGRELAHALIERAAAGAEALPFSERSEAAD